MEEFVYNSSDIWIEKILCEPLLLITFEMGIMSRKSFRWIYDKRLMCEKVEKVKIA